MAKMKCLMMVLILILILILMLMLMLIMAVRLQPAERPPSYGSSAPNRTAEAREHLPIRYEGYHRGGYLGEGKAEDDSRVC